MRAGPVLVEAGFINVVRFGAVEVGAVVGGGERGRAEVGEREEEVLGAASLRAEELRQNAVAIEGVHAGVRITKRGHAGEVTVAHGDAGNVGTEKIGARAARLIERQLEERLVLPQRTAECRTVVVNILERFDGGKSIAGVESAVAAVPEQVAVIPVATGAGHRRDDAHTAEFRFVAQNIRREFADRFHRGLGHRIRRAEIAEVRFDAVNLGLDAIRARAGSNPGGTGSDLNQTRNGERHHLKNQAGVAGVVEHAAQIRGQFAQRLQREAGGDGGAFQLDYAGNLAAHFDGVGRVADFDAQIRSNSPVSGDRKGRSGQLFKALGFDTQFIIAWQNIGEDVHSGVIGTGAAFHVRGGVPQPNGGTGNYGA